MAKKLKIGLVGCGYVAKQDYFPVFARPKMREIFEVSALCDNVPGRAESFTKMYGFGKPYVSYEKMLEEADMDLIAIITPIPLHFDQAMKALATGRHVYIQKTMTVRYEEAAEINRFATEKGLSVCASPGQMIIESHQQAKKLIDRGSLGKICFVKGQGPHPGHERQELFGVNPAWYYLEGGGPLMDVAVYPLTSITGILGPAKRVTAFSGISIPDRYWEGKKLDVRMDDNSVMLIDFGENRFATVNGNFVTLRTNTPQVEFFGSKGVLQLGGWCIKDMPIQIYSEEPYLNSRAGWYRPMPPHDLPKPEDTMVWTMADLFHQITCIRDNRKPYISSENAAHVIEIIEKAYVSAKSGKVQELQSTFQTFTFEE